MFEPYTIGWDVMPGHEPLEILIEMRLADLDEEQSREKRQAVAFAGAEKAGGFPPVFCA
jgi:hypothetical protein